MLRLGSASLDMMFYRYISEVRTRLGAVSKTEISKVYEQAIRDEIAKIIAEIEV